MPIRPQTVRFDLERESPVSHRDHWDLVVSYVQARLAPVIKSERGASLVEYALVVGLIAVVCIAAVTFLGSRTSSRFSSIGNRVG